MTKKINLLEKSELGTLDNTVRQRPADIVGRVIMLDEHGRREKITMS
jgi:hypothetical protein